MPRIARTRKLQENIVGEPHEGAAGGPALVGHPGDEEWRKSFDPLDPSIPFFDVLRCMTERDWQRHVLYLYRVAPEVRNRSAQEKYIARITDPTSEEINGEWMEWLAREHGGGRYFLWLKDDSKPVARGRRSDVLAIEGEPHLQPGQILSTEQPQALLPAAPVNAQQPGNNPAGSEVVSAMREVTNLLRDRPADMGVEQVIENMGKGYDASLKLIARSAEYKVTSATGSPLGDRLLDKFLESSNAKQPPAMDPRLEKILDLAIERIANPEPPPRSGSIGDLNAVKDLFGADSIADVFQRFSGGADDGAWKMELVKMGVAFVTSLPQLFAMLSANRDREFQQKLYLAQLNRGQPATPPASHQPSPAPVATMGPRAVQFPPPPPPPAAVEPSPTTIGAPMAVLDPMRAALDEIVDYFDEGVDGATTARLVQKHFPAIVIGLKPLLADANMVKEFAARTPPLSEIAGESEFPQFMRDFCQQVLHPPEEEGVSPAEPS